MKSVQQIIFKSLLVCLLFCTLSVSDSLAEQRITPDQIKQILDNLDKDLQKEMAENNGKLDLERVRDSLDEEILEDYILDKEARVEEAEAFKAKFNKLVKHNKKSNEQKIEMIKKLVKDTLQAASTTQPIACMKSLKSCNVNSCCKGLVCAEEPAGKELREKSCKKSRLACNSNSECCSGSCEATGKSKKKTCQKVFRCYPPQKIGSKCNKNPVCLDGLECLPFNLETNGLKACVSNSLSCSSDSACCSGSCEKGICVNNLVCKDCVKQSQKAKRGRKCCEGLMKNESGVCVPDTPPLIIYNKFKFLKVFSISHAQTNDEARREQNAQLDRQAQEAAQRGNQIIDNQEQTAREGRENQSQAGTIYALPTTNPTSDKQTGTQYIKGNKRKFKSAGAQSLSKGAVVNTHSVKQAKDKIPAYSVLKGSDFKTCDINFKRDYFIQMKNKNVPNSGASLLNVEGSLLGFEYVALGDEIVKDHWIGPGIKRGSINERLKDIAIASRKNRIKVYEDIEDSEIATKCLCIYALGVKKIDSQEFADKKKFLENSCPKELRRVNKERDRLAKLGDEGDKLSGDASGIKYKILMTQWSAEMTKFQLKLLKKNTTTFVQMDKVAKWALEQAQWNQALDKKYKLYKFTIINYRNKIASTIGAGVAAALLAAGVISIMGGFAAGATLSAWAAAGIIASSAVTGATGGWLIASLKGAWLSKAPEVNDKVVRSSYKCGKKTQCTDFQRTLHQPYNKICNTHTSANACIKSLVIYRDGKGKDQYLIDPWVPRGIPFKDIVKDKRDYVRLLEDGFKRTLPILTGKRPGGRKGEGYLKKPFLTESVVGHYTPRLLKEDSYVLNQLVIANIKKGAMEYSVEESFFEKSQVENQRKFSDFVFEWHFLWPRLSPGDRIAYPMPALVSYLELLTFGYEAASRGNQSLGLGFVDVARQQLKDLEKTIARFNLENEVGISGTFKDDLDRLRKTIAGAGSAFSSDGAGNLSGSNSAGSGGDALLRGGDNLRLFTDGKNAISALDKSRAEKNKRLELFKKQVGNSQRGKDLLAARNNLVNGFLTGSSRPGVVGKGFSNNAASTSEANKEQTKEDDKQQYYPSGVENDGNAFKEDYMSNAGKTDSRADADIGSDLGDESDDSEQALSAAVNAIDKEGKDKFKGKEKDSLFSRITKAYFRSYNKVLDKKKKLDFDK